MDWSNAFSMSFKLPKVLPMVVVTHVPYFKNFWSNSRIPSTLQKNIFLLSHNMIHILHELEMSIWQLCQDLIYKHSRTVFKCLHSDVEVSFLFCYIDESNPMDYAFITEKDACKAWAPWYGKHFQPACPWGKVDLQGQKDCIKCMKCLSPRGKSIYIQLYFIHIA